MVGWYVLYIRYNHEKKVHMTLRDREIESFLPLVEDIKGGRGRRKKILKPLFPSYLFVYVDGKSEFHKCLSVKGVVAGLKAGNEYSRVSQQEIDYVKILIGDKSVTGIEVLDSSHFSIGEERKIEYGPLAGLKCSIQKINNKNSILVQLKSMKSCITASMPPGYIGMLDK